MDNVAKVCATENKNLKKNRQDVFLFFYNTMTVLLPESCVTCFKLIPAKIWDVRKALGKITMSLKAN